ncbi:MAG: VOC family protein [Phycisphaeraceae bacterium]|nr:VOC family protein [Phycisphaerales bacterium]MCB9860076.1 VOC family protein [Phycisphaeraceae bacterium]
MQLSELVLIARDVRASCEFYRDIVGLQLEREPTDDWAWFVIGNADPPQRLALSRGPLLFEEHSRLPEGERFGPVHFAFRVDRSTLETRVQRLLDSSVKVFGPQRLEWMRATSYYFYDPDQNQVEFTAVDPPE